MSEQSKGCLVHYDSCHIQVRRDYFQLCAYDKNLFNKRLNSKGKPVKDEPNQECMAKLLRLLETLTNTEKAHYELVATEKKPAPKEYPLELSWTRICALLFNTFGESIVRNSMAVLVARKQVRVHQETSNSTPVYFFQVEAIQKALDIQAKQGCENTTRGGVKIQPVGCENTTINNSNNNGDKKESVDAPTLEQPEITPTLSDDEALGYETSTHPSMQLSTQANSNVDKLADSDNGSHSQQSYSHRQDTSPATHVGVMPVLEVPMPPGVKIPDAPRVQPPTPPFLTLVQKSNPEHSDEAIAIRRLYDTVHGISTGHPDWEWKKMEDMAASGVVPTREDMQLVYDHLKKASKKHTIAHVWEAWGELPALKKPVVAPSGEGHKSAQELFEEKNRMLSERFMKKRSS